jgi:phosphoribosylpyrophosphate synthetase
MSLIDLSILSGKPQATADKDLFAVADKRKAWEKEKLARCDFQKQVKILHRPGFYFMSVWNKSVKGRTLVDIKADDRMIPFFATHVGELIADTVGTNLTGWAIVSSPKRRHKEHNFASLIAEEIGKRLSIPFYDDCALAQNRERINAVFTANNIPAEQNIIVFDDFVTTGSTIIAMKNLLDSLGKMSIYFVGINNHLSHGL